MTYKIINVENDELAGLILNEIAEDLKNENDENVVLKEVVKNKDETKGFDIQAVCLMIQQAVEQLGPEVLEAIETGVMSIVYSIISAAIWDRLNDKIVKYKNLDEYSSKTEIGIEITDKKEQKISFKISFERILKKRG